MIRIGCSGWSYPHWRGMLYPESGSSARRLALYAKSFDTVEINATFYRLPRSSTVTGWATKTPAGFCFAVKGSRYVTHVKRLREMSASVARLAGRIGPLRASHKLGPILWQLPPTFKRDDLRLAEALAALPEGRHAFEFRHASWFDDDVYALLKAHGVALVVVAVRRSGPRRGWTPPAGRTFASMPAEVETGTTRREKSSSGPSWSRNVAGTATSTSTTTGRATPCETLLP